MNTPIKTREQRERDSKRAEELAKRSLEALAARDYSEAEQALREQLDIQPGNFVTLYNLACIRALQGDTLGASDDLAKAIENGFCDIHQLDRDPQLAAVRRTDFYKTLKAGWADVLIARRDANLRLAADMFKGTAYSNTLDDRLRIAFRSGVDPGAAETARSELNRLAEWADSDVMPGILDPEAMRSDPYVVVVLPTKFDFSRWAVSMFGVAANNGVASVGGSYEHDSKRLITQDLGASLRHEFFHCLHWRSCTRLDQVHPIWIQEGLCSLVEDFDLDPDGRIVPATSWRTNTLKRMDRVRKILTLDQLAKQTHEQFNGPGRLGLYAHARTVFLYLAQHHKLKDWYRLYTQGFSRDRTGVAALEAAFGQPIAAIDDDFKRWMRAIPDVPEQTRPGMASLGIEVDAGTGEGPIVSDTPANLGGRARNGLRALLAPGDIISALDDHSVRDLPELLRLLGKHQPGDSVKLLYRRGRLYHTIDAELLAAP